MRQNLALPGVAVAPRSDPKALAPRRWLGSSNQVLQTKLRVGAVDDPLEREADRVADAVVGGMALPSPSAAPPGLQRKCEDCEAEESETVRRKAADASAPARGAEAAAAVASGGAPLSADVRAYFEPRFGRDLSAVRVHADSAAARAAQRINARAFTLGRDIAFAPGEYAPRTRQGRRLIAHELAHVAQQSEDRGDAVVRRWTSEDCSPPQLEEIGDAARAASVDLAVALRLLGTRPVPDQARNALWLSFRDDSEQAADAVRSRIAHLGNTTGMSNFVCRSQRQAPCRNHPEAAGVSDGRPGGRNVHLCYPRFGNLLPINQSGAVIHEVAHNFLNAADRGYFASDCSETAPDPGHQQSPQDLHSGTAGDNPLFRFDNADAYTCFVQLIVHSGAEALRTRAAGYRGENVRIEAEDTTTIFVQRGSRRRHDPSFRLRGLPVNSGFRFRWHLAASGQQFRLNSQSPADPWVFNDATTSVFIPEALETLLRSQGVSRAAIECEIALFGTPTRPQGASRPYPDRFEASVIRRTLEITFAQTEDPLPGLRETDDPLDDLDLGSD